MSAWKPRYCHWCGKPIKREGGGKDAKKYCCKPCYFDAVRAGDQQFKGRRHDAWAAFVDWSHEWDGQRPKPRKPRPRKERASCKTCGKEVNKGASRFCSYACTKAWRGERRCRCGAVVSDCSAFGRPSCKGCKRESARIHKRLYGCYRRRCRTYGGHFNSGVKPKDIFARDRWRCHVCNRKTRKFYRNGDPLSATVDHHPIPLSKGGDHDWHNVRCACKRCNELKGNKWNGQRRLRFGAAG